MIGIPGMSPYPEIGIREVITLARKSLWLILILVLTPRVALAHGGSFDFHLFGAPPVISNLIWTAFLTTAAILSLFALSRAVERRVRQVIREERRRIEVRDERTG